jgi:hypothetical protein
MKKVRGCGQRSFIGEYGFLGEYVGFLGVLGEYGAY